jgi:hypothetical protein
MRRAGFGFIRRNDTYYLWVNEDWEDWEKPRISGSLAT